MDKENTAKVLTFIAAGLLLVAVVGYMFFYAGSFSIWMIITAFICAIYSKHLKGQPINNRQTHRRKNFDINNVIIWLIIGTCIVGAFIFFRLVMSALRG